LIVFYNAGPSGQRLASIVYVMIINIIVTLSSSLLLL